MSYFDSPKNRLILRPFLLIWAGCLIFYSGLHVALLRLYPVLPFREDLFRLFIPFFIPWPAMVIWLRPGLRNLQFSRRTKGLFAYLYLAGLAISISIILLQAYIPQIAGRRTVITNIRQIDSVPEARYYQITHFYAEHRALRQYSFERVTGRGSGTLEFHHYALLPMYTDSAALNPRARTRYPDPDATKIDPLYFPQDVTKAFLRAHPPKAWVCLYQRETMNNRALYIDKTAYRQRVEQEWSDQIQSRFWDTVTYWEQAPNDVDRRCFMNLIPGELVGDHRLLLIPRTTPIPPRHLFYIGWTLFSLAAGFGVFGLMIRFTPLR